MSLAGQITDTITAIAATRDARAQALGGIRQDTARFLKDARSTQHRVSVAQKKALAESARSTKLATAITLGAADEQIDAYRRARHRRAEALAVDLADGSQLLRRETAAFLSATFADRRQKALAGQRDRNQAIALLRKDVGALRAAHAAFVDSLSEDRQEASQLWQDRTRKAAPKPAARTRHQAASPQTASPQGASPQGASPEAPQVPHPGAEKADAAPAAAEAAPVETVKLEPVKAEPAKEAPKQEVAKQEAKPAKMAKVEDGKADGAKSDAPKSDAPKSDAPKADDGKPAGGVISPSRL